MAEPHLKTGGEEQYIRSQNAVSKVDEEVLDAFKQLKLRRRYRFLVFRLEGEAILLETTGEPEMTLAQLVALLPESECRYAIFDHESVSTDGRKVSKLYFISWLPHNSSPPMKMAYTHGKSVLRGSFDGCYDINASAVHEIERGLGLQDQKDDDSGSEFEDE